MKLQSGDRFRCPVRIVYLLGVGLALVASACGVLSGERLELLPKGEGLPDREIMFVLGDPAATILGFLNSDGSGYVTREVRISEGFPGELLPFGGRILGPWFTWSPDGRSLAGKVGNTIAPAGVPFIISETGELKVCPQAEELPYGRGRPWIVSGTTAMTVNYSSSKRIYEVKSMDVEACTELVTQYSGIQGEVIYEAVLSSQEWLAIERSVGPAPHELVVLDSQSNQITLIPEGRSPAWSRDGELVAYAVLGDGIYITHKDGSSARRVVAAGSADFPTWSPDAQWIAYHRVLEPGGPKVIEKANVSSGETFQLFEGAYYPSWRWTSEEYFGKAGSS